VDIWRSLRLIRTKPWLFIIGTLVGFVLVLFGPSFLTKPLQVYQSTAKILITPNSSGSVDPGVRTWFVDESTIRVLLSSQDLLDVVLESAGSKVSWLELKDRIKVEILSKGNVVSLLEVSVVGGKAEEVRVLTQTLSEKFIQYVQQLSAAEHDKTVAYLERERRSIEREMARSHKRLLKLGFFPAGSGRSNSVEDTWVQLQTRRNDLEREFAMAQAEVEQLQIAASESSETMGLIEGAGTAMLQDSLAKERIKLAELREVYTERSVQVQQQLQKLNKVEAVQKVEFGRAISARMKAAQKKSEKLSSLLAQTKTRLQELESKRPGPEKQFEYANEDRQLQMWQESFLAITRQLYTARGLQQSSRREGAFTIVEKPQPGRLVAGQSTNQSLGSRVAMAIPLGLIVGVALVMAADYLSTSMRLEPRIEEALGLPIIGSIPNVPEDTSSSWDLMKQNLRRPKAPV
jgi:capsular polysaccharide biosynthesis protein